MEASFVQLSEMVKKGKVAPLQPYVAQRGPVG